MTHHRVDGVEIYKGKWVIEVKMYSQGPGSLYIMYEYTHTILSNQSYTTICFKLREFKIAIA